MTPLTLKYSGTEKWLGPPGASGSPGWGYSYAVMHLRSQAPGTFHAVEAPESKSGNSRQVVERSNRLSACRVGRRPGMIYRKNLARSNRE